MITKKILLQIVSGLIGISALVDTQFELLKSVGIPENYIAIIKLSGLILALFLPSISSKKRE